VFTRRSIIVFDRLRKPSRAEIAAAGLLESARAAARRPALFGDGRIPDTLDGRFESMALHAGLLILRLRSDGGEEAATVAQRLFDALFRDLDSAVRELGAFDLGVSKRIRTMAEAFYGRLSAYRDALAVAGDETLREALARNVLPPTASPQFLDALTAYVRSSHVLQRAQPVAALMAGEAPPWAELVLAPAVKDL
jgi:cytochrome b pre-mRNA-processing protein 3